VQHIEIRRHIPSDRERVWEMLADHRGWARWSGLREVVIRQQGDPPPNGLGAIRVVRGGGLAVEEEITGFEPPERLSYRISGGLPLREHSATIELAPADGATDLVWRVAFSPRVPGTGPLLRRAIERMLRRAVEGLAARA